MNEIEPLGERVYARLKEDVSSGFVSEHVRLDFAELALRYEASTTPVREAAMRLLGEGLLEVHPKGGLRPTHIRESDLKALLELHGQLAALALRWKAVIPVAVGDTGGADGHDRARQFFIDLARATGNGQFVRVVEQIEDRLERFRRLDGRLLPEVAAELVALERAVSSPTLLRPLLRRYHKRRQGIVAHSIVLAAAENINSQDGG